MFTIQKTKVWNFLLWLNTHNRLYTDINLDRMTMDTYPENGLLPSIEDQIVIVSTISHLSSFCLYLISMLCHMHKHLLLFTHTRIQPRVRI